MADLTFAVVASWAGLGVAGAGQLAVGEGTYEFSVPTEMGGRGVGTSPEELLTCAVCTCFTSTLFALLSRARLPAAKLTVAAQGKVTGFPGRDARFAEIRVNPTVHEGDTGRLEEYARFACQARDRCFIGRTLQGNVAYQVDEVSVESGLGTERTIARCSVWPIPVMEVPVSSNG